MKSEVGVLERGIARARWRVIDFLELMKPELTGLSVLTALCGFYLGSRDSVDLWLLISTALGTLLVGGGAGALNQYLERHYDAKMRRTEKRPLPSGRLRPVEGLWFGILISMLGIVLLTATVNPLTGFLAVTTLVTYLFLYTPLKRLTPFSTWVGGVPGALPPLMGWVAATNEITLPGLILSAVVFFWQIPHFHSLAWLYRRDYQRAGFKMLSVVDEDGSRTSAEIVFSSIALILASLGLTVVGTTGPIYLVIATLLGLTFLGCAVLFAHASVQVSVGATGRNNFYARRVFSASLLYLPALMITSTIDKL